LLIVVRHGRTAWNAEGRFQGWADPPLDAEGQRQSVETAAALSIRLHGQPVRVVTSDLRRAAGTAAVVAAALDAQVTATAELREVDVGTWEGMTRAEVGARFPNELRRWSDGEDLRRGGGETRAESGVRVARCVARLLAAGPDPLIVVGHGVSLQAGLSALAEQHLVRLEGPAPHLENAGYLFITGPVTYSGR
jgi:broad specificity phosphatase PhoE